MLDSRLPDSHEAPTPASTPTPIRMAALTAIALDTARCHARGSSRSQQTTIIATAAIAGSLTAAASEQTATAASGRRSIASATPVISRPTISASLCPPPTR